MSSEAHTSLEIERKYDVDADTALPDWSALPGVASVGAPEPRELDARYLDTPGRALAAEATALRRRTGGPDEGWHIKRTTPEGKLETRWPLDEQVDAEAHPVVPQAVLEALEALAPLAGPPFVVLARIRNDRTAYALRDGAGGVVAEFVDDRVVATDAARGASSSWREWELELGPAAPVAETERAALFAAADALVTAVGGRVATSGSKLARALGAES